MTKDDFLETRKISKELDRQIDELKRLRAENLAKATSFVRDHFAKRKLIDPLWNLTARGKLGAPYYLGSPFESYSSCHFGSSSIWITETGVLFNIINPQYGGDPDETIEVTIPFDDLFLDLDVLVQRHTELLLAELKSEKDQQLERDRQEFKRLKEIFEQQELVKRD